MAHGEAPEERMKEPGEEIGEEQFLKDLYLYMKRRETPIERIPHLGFKQIDLFVMFKTVRDLGGYHQVTAQQQWKQIYNTLGGNPRSTSAATCTRRHYEKLLLPYECHLKGILMSAVPQNQPKHLQYHGFSGDAGGDNGPRPAKRKLIPIPLHQSFYNPKSDPQGKIFPMPFHYPQYYPPSHAVLSPYVPMSPPVLTSHSPPVPVPQFPVPSSNANPTSSDREKGPLEYLRGLADKYKNLTGLTEPLNLSTKASSPETTKNPMSSFSPPSSIKKFLNQPSSLYSPHHLQVARDAETQDGEVAADVAPHSYLGEQKDAYIVDVKPASSSPTYVGDTTAAAQKPSSPKTDLQTVCPKEEREGSPEAKRLNLSHILPSLPRDNGGKMEIEIPLSVLHKWLRMCHVEPSSTTHGPMQLTVLPTKEERTGSGEFSETGVLATNVPSHVSPQRQSPAAEDLRRRHPPSPTTTSQTRPSPHHHDTSPNHSTCYRPLSSGGVLKNAPGREVYHAKQEDTTKSYSIPPGWGAYDIETLKAGPGPLKRGRVRSEPSTVLMVDSIPGSVLRLTADEVMKLKKIISSSS